MTSSKNTLNTNPVILLKNDFDILNGFVKNVQGMQVSEKENFAKLYQEIKKAHVVESDEIPDNVVRLGSEVIIRDLSTQKEMRITIVLPQQADIREKKISVLAPIGTALIGFAEGQQVSWDVPSGKKNFMIMKVKNTVTAEKTIV